MRQAQATTWSVHRHTWHLSSYRLLAPCDGDVSYSVNLESLCVHGATIEALQTRASPSHSTTASPSRSRLQLPTVSCLWPARAVPRPVGNPPPPPTLGLGLTDSDVHIRDGRRYSPGLAVSDTCLLCELTAQPIVQWIDQRVNRLLQVATAAASPDRTPHPNQSHPQE